PLFMGGTSVMMPPAAFLQRPLRWLQAVSRHEGETSGGPNFSYDLCVERVTEEEKAGLDLGGWRVAFCGAEPVRAPTMERFAAAFAGCGFRRTAFFPCYGLAEATLFVAGGRAGDPPVARAFEAAALERDRAVPAAGAEGAATLMGCGAAWGEGRMEIVHPESRVACRPGEVGEIWVAGPHVAAGYWNRTEATDETFGAHLADGDGPFLRTGDLGFVDGGDLFVTGRAKDLIILRGRNLYPQDIEATAAASHAALQPAGGAAFPVDADGEERLVIVHEVRRTALRALDPAAVMRRIREEVAAAHEAAVHDVVLIGPATLPKTSSGKVQRQACRRDYLSGLLEPVGAPLPDEADVVSAGTVSPGAASPDAASPDAASPDDASPLEALLRDEAARVLRSPAAALRPELPLTALGLDSMGAARLAAAVEEATGVSIDPVLLLEPTPLRELAASLASLAPAHPRAAPGDAREAVGEEPFPLSAGQRALWFLHQLAPESAAYNLAVAVGVRGALDAGTVSAALNEVVARHAALRTMLDPDEPVQRVLPRFELALEVRDAGGGAAALREALDREARRPFDFGDGPPLRAGLYRRGEGDHVLLLVAHHAVLDFRSLEIVFSELFRALLSRLDGGPALGAAGTQYPGYVRWQRDLLAGAEGERLRARLVERLGGAPAVLALPTDRPHPPVRVGRGGTVPLAAGAALWARLREQARAEGVTPYVLLLAAFQVLLARWSGQDDFVVGSPAAGRTGPAFANTVGYLVNPVAVRARLGGAPTFRELLQQARAQALAALSTQAYPFERLVEDLRPARDASRTPVFQVLFVFQQAERLTAATACALGVAGVREAIGPLTLESVAVDTGAAQFDLTLTLGEVDGVLAGTLGYDADLFDDATIQRMAGHFHRLLAAIAADPDVPVSALPMLGAEERRAVVEDFNATAVRYDGEATLHELVEAQVSRTPDAVAVTFEGQSVTYAELNRRAGQLAGHLRQLGVGVETRVGICLERSIDLVVALLGVLKAGGAYVPVDPGYPAERIAYMLADSGVRVLLTQASLAASLPEHGARVVRLDEDWPSIASASPSYDPIDVPPHALAYVIYTSGSTGRPKGAMNAHRGIVNRLLWMQAEYGLAASDAVLQKTPFSFDVSVWEFFWPLITGARLVMARPEGHRDPAYLSSVIEREGITTLHFVPSMLRVFLEHGDAARCGSVRRVISSGEALGAELAARCLERLPRAALHNLYGPTEAAVDVTAWRCSADDADGGGVPIGRPVANTRAYVLDRAGQPVPIGVAGELCLGGLQVGRGYLGRPGLTAERFIPDPWSAEPGARLYRTGDLARWRADAALEYRGRIDHQVKVRGFRIEPGEIEAALAAHPAVREAVVAARDDAGDETRLVAYIVANGEAPPADALRAFLRERLPEHMVPAAFVALDAIPLSPSGKADRRALPAPDRAAGGTAAYVAPRSTTEAVLAEIWAGVLGVERVGVHDHFFDRGGSSLGAVQVVSRVHQEFGVSLPLHALFQAPTIEALSLHIARAQLESQPHDEVLRLLAELEAGTPAGD
ncbi:MAG TPA: amino acid adenylation domain-containing protein, partial [Longimicrobium sp.]|nr:amino acid adenylation domain-containing protein [Longimicrobium sp.]